MRWVKIYDSILDWRWHHKPEYVSFMLHCLLKANPKPTKWETIELEKGQFVTSMKSMCETIGISERTYRTIVKNLTDCGFLAIKTTNKYTVVTICNYASYQATKEDKRQSNDNQTTYDSQSNDNQTTYDSQSNDNQTTTDIDIENNRIKQFRDNKNKETFLKNGGTAEKKVFQISELEKILSAENIYMTAQGYQEFKNLNESDSRYGYKGGIVRSARIFLKNPKNAIYRKNPPPAPPTVQKKDFIPDAETKKIWDKISDKMKTKIGVVDWKLWIQPLIPVAVKDKQLTIKIPSRFVYEQIESKFIQPFKKTLNENGIETLEYQL